MQDLGSRGARRKSDATEAVDLLIRDELRNRQGNPTHALVVSGPPCSGKTEFALESMLEGLRAFGNEATVMVVSQRKAAAELSNAIIRRTGVSDQTRPVGTLAALAFRILAQARASQSQPMPKLLNGAEQDSLLRRVLAGHVQEMLRGDSCESCMLLAGYFGNADETSSRLSHAEDPIDATRGGSPSAMTHNGITSQTTDMPWWEVLAPGVGKLSLADSKIPEITDIMALINDDFASQLRDMLARMNELGLSLNDEGRVLQSLSSQGLDFPQQDRLNTQWSLAFHLWHEYAEEIERQYGAEFRLDASRLLVEATRMVDGSADRHIPRFIVIDDWQDLTLAGMSFIQALESRGSRLVLIGNGDESVQTFRGAYPEFLASRVACETLQDDREENRALVSQNLGRLGAARRDLTWLPIVELHRTGDSPEGKESPHTYLDVLGSRVSLSIAGEVEGDIPLAQRPGKLPQWEGSLPITALPDSAAQGPAMDSASDGSGASGRSARSYGAESGRSERSRSIVHDGTVHVRMMRTAEAEMDDILWQIKHETLAAGRDWNDMAVIAHDNSTVRAFGERLREQGIAVRYSAITRPLKDESVVGGLFAFIELVERRINPKPSGNARTQSMWFANRMRTLLSSPLMPARNAATKESRPIRIQRLESLLDTCCALCTIDADDDHGEEPPVDARDAAQSKADINESLIDAIRRQTLAWAEDVNRRVEIEQQSSGITIDDAAHDISQAPRMTRQLLLTRLVVGDESSREEIVSVLNAIAAGHGKDPDMIAFARAMAVLSSCTDGVDNYMRSHSIASVDQMPADVMLWLAWDACKLAQSWQEESLQPGSVGESANDRLDALMRLFQLAGGSQSYANVDDFMRQVRGMQIEADSLAHIGPIEHAVTLTTPAGALAQAKRWKIVWMPVLQQGIWPNLAERDTLFGTEELANVVLHGSVYGVWTSGEAGDIGVARAASSTARLITTLNAEKRSFLVSLTRAKEQLRISAVWNADTVPSDLLFGMLPEYFQRLSDLAEVPYSEVGDQFESSQILDGTESRGQWAGLETSVRGIVTLARSQLAGAVMRESPESGIPGGERTLDSIATLRMLSRRGYAEADPRSWPFVYMRETDMVLEAGRVSADPDKADPDTTQPDMAGSHKTQPDTAQRGDVPRTVSAVATVGTVATVNTVATVGTDDHAAPDDREPHGDSTVVLTPSAVDAIWQCPLEWVLSSQLTGPMPSNVNMQFGTLIHKVAQIATEEGLDRLASHAPAEGHEALKATLTERLEEIYADLVKGDVEQSSPEDMFESASKRRLVPTILHNLASYFVDGTRSDYASEGKSPVQVGEFKDSMAEQPFDMRIGIDDIVPIWNATYPDHALDAHGLFALMSSLSGGFMPSMPESATVRITGRIDRIEGRERDGAEVVRIVDYKTGRRHSAKAMFNDLQLVCYQLAMSFDHSLLGHRAKLGRVSQADLFEVALHDAPACFSGAPEASYQPGLIVNGKFDSVFEARKSFPSIDKFIDYQYNLDDGRESMDPGLWEFVVQNQRSQGIWALSMISRVFFAASVRMSSSDERLRLDAGRCHKTNGSTSGSGMCRAWELLHANVMEERR
ncbi:MAG: PD-(D/E)XK nuclease family protein [Bifidobacterium sp.]|uniref:PD-(D/E)XK nuclease family protein n=2 Tax=Bifidobacterium TaxID=1678 RepID=A0AB39UGS6_9BIFI